LRLEGISREAGISMTAWPRTPMADQYRGMAIQGGTFMRELRVTIPDGVEFADLRLTRDVDDGRVRFSMAPIAAICEASDLDPEELVDGSQPLVVLVIAAWYRAHISEGGAPDPVQEDLLEETRLEMEHGGGFSYPPGHA
jgi:hypothetical protein